MASRPTPRRNAFTLIELLIVLAIAGILAAVAMPSFVQHVRKGRRSDAHEAAAAVMQAQERWRSNRTKYSDTLEPLGVSGTSKGGYYRLELSAASGIGYTLRLTAVEGKSQAKDTGCTALTVTVTGGAPSYGEPACWSR